MRGTTEQWRESVLIEMGFSFDLWEFGMLGDWYGREIEFDGIDLD